MPLVTYSDSDNDSNPASPPKTSSEEHPPTRKRSRTSSTSGDPSPSLPPLPASFHNLYATPVRTSNADDPSIHGGRSRAIPHIEGNWPTHVYIEWYPSLTETAHIEDLISQHHPSSGVGGISNGDTKRDDSVKSLLQSELGAAQPLHISLSQSLNLRAEQREPFIDRLRSEIQRTGVTPFTAHLQSPTWTSNYSHTREFLVLPIAAPAPANGLNRLLAACNTTAEAFAQPSLYVPAPSKPRPGGGSGGSGINGRKKRQRGGNGTALISTPRSIWRNAIETARDQILPDAGSAFHISIAWKLGGGSITKEDGISQPAEPEPNPEVKIDSATNPTSPGTILKDISIPIRAVKAKVGNSIVEFKLGAIEGAEDADVLGMGSTTPAAGRARGKTGMLGL